MESDSDDDFERFLQEEDSASVSSASPVKKKVSASSRTSKSKASASQKNSFSGRDKAYAIVNAAEKLLAGSARAKKKPVAVHEAEEEEEEAPPPYSDDPYAFNLEDVPPRYGQRDHQDSEDNEEGGTSKRSVRKSKKKGKNDEPKNSRGKKKEQEPLASKKEVRLTLEERVAEILKRTGSTAYPSGVPEEPKVASEADGDSEDSERNGDAKLGASGSVESRDVGRGRMAPLSVEREAVEDSGDNSDLQRLSFSDSLGMESADFEVGALAKRKLDRSRLSLSRLNSEKFAVNLEALEESEQISHNRYERNLDEVRKRSLDASDGADSDYDEERFELDQTTDASGLELATHISNVKADNVSQSSFVSEFESMKNVFSLDFPIKEDSKKEGAQVEDASSMDGADRPPLESDNFGYDDEDFEADETKDAETANIAPPTAISIEFADPYVDDGFDEAELANVNSSIDSHAGVSRDEQQIEERQRSVTQNDRPSHDVDSDPLPTEQTNNNDFPSITQTQDGFKSPQLPHVPHLSHSPPQSPPPPPPPDDDESQPALPLQTEAKTYHSRVVNASNDPTTDKSGGRFREIEHQVSSLRFVRDSSRDERVLRTNIKLSQDESVQTIAIEDPELMEKLKDIDQLMEQARRMRSTRAKSASVRSSARENELALRLQQAQRQLLQFKHHIQELAEEDGPSGDRDEGDRAALQQSGLVEVKKSASTASTKELEALHHENDQLKKEMQSQERLIQAFQRENEQLMKQLKQVQREVNYDVHKENETLRIQLKDLRMLLDGAQLSGNEITHGDGVEGKARFRATIEARLQAEALAKSLQEELITLTKRHQERVNELKIELEKVKKAKIDLECRYEGIDLERVEAESRQIKELNEQIQVQKTEHSHAIIAMQKKIDWYANNQRLLDEQDGHLKSLKEQNKQLQEQLSDSRHAEGVNSDRSPTKPVKSGQRHTADLRKIQELESRLSEMETAMRRRHPDSLVSLIVASRKAEEESKIAELEEQFRMQLAGLADELEETQAGNEKKLNAFRQQQEKLVLQYQKHIADLESQLANKENQRGVTTAMRRSQKKRSEVTSAEETELYRVRRFYAEKIKEVERKWEAKYQSLKKQHYASNGADPEQQDSNPSDTTRIIRNLQQKVAFQDEYIRSLGNRSNGPKTWETSDLRRRVSSLEAQLQMSEEARRQLVDTISSLNAVAPHTEHSKVSDDARTDQVPTRRVSELEQQLSTQRNEHEVVQQQYQERIKILENQVTDQSAGTQNLLSQISNHIKEVERLQKLLVEAEHDKRRLQARADKVPLLESEIAQLRDQVAVPQTPSMLQFRSLELRIETLTQKHQLREAELKMLLAQATQSSQLEKLNFERMYQNAIALKNAEISKFKKQLGEILDELEALRRPAASKS